MSDHYDVVIVGAGVAGSALAHALATITSPSRSSTYSSPNLNILLLERSLPPPDRIVGELLQPAGVQALRTLGLFNCLKGIDAVPVRGYCVCHDGSLVHIPYPQGHEGRSFHHGRFIARLRESAIAAPGVRVMQATVTELVHCQESGRVIGVRATRKKHDGQLEDSLGESWVVPPHEKNEEKEEEKETLTFTGDLIFIADGCFSNFRKSILIPGANPPSKPVTKSHFVGVVLKDAKLPIDEHGTVALVKGHGPVLLYQISEHNTRILIDVRQPLPQNLKVPCLFYLFFLFVLISNKHPAFSPTSLPTSSINCRPPCKNPCALPSLPPTG
jgi:squalene monooxygenase